MENEKEYALSTELVKNIPFDKYDKDFTFIVNDKEYKTSRFVADLLSPIICNFHMTDSSINSFEIKTTETNTGIDFNDILSLMTFERRRMKSNEEKIIQEIFLLLGNESEYMKIDQNTEYDQIADKEKVLTNLQNKIKLLKMNKRDINIYSQEIDYISSHFSEFSAEKKSEMKKIPIEIIQLILQNEKFQINEEDELLKFINELVKEKEEFSILYDYVEFGKVSEEELIKFRDTFSLDYITQKIFKSIINRTIKDEETKSSKTTKYTDNSKVFEYKEDHQFEGIIKYLNDKTGGNSHDKGTLEVTSNSFYSTSYHPKNLLDFNEDNCYLANNESDVWIKFDFKNEKVKLTNYSIKCHKDGNHQLKSWIIETSNDNENWQKIDEHVNDQTLKSYKGSKSFKVETCEFSQYVRLRQTSEPWDGNSLWFHYIEFFGYLQNP